LGVGWSTLVAAELIAATSGLGFMVQSAAQFLVTDVVVLGILVIALIAFAMEMGLRALQRKVGAVARPGPLNLCLVKNPVGAINRCRSSDRLHLVIDRQIKRSRASSAPTGSVLRHHEFEENHHEPPDHRPLKLRPRRADQRRRRQPAADP
jgi:hypothetical protein